MSSINNNLANIDPELWQAIQAEHQRQEHHIELIASENYVSRAVLQAQGSQLTNKYAEGYPGKRYYGGCTQVDVAETLAIERAKQLFGAAYANVQPHSGSQANQAVYMAALKPGDTILGMSLASGGHLTHGASVNLSGKLYHALSYGLNAKEEIDFDEVERLAREHNPRMIVAGASAFSRVIDNSVISLENIYRHLEMGASPKVAAEEGGAEVNLAVLAATLVDVVDFFPVTFLFGVSKFLFSALALAFCLSLLASFVVAMTVIPLFCSKFLTVHHGASAHGEHAEDGADEGEVGPEEDLTWGGRFNAWFNRVFEKFLNFYELWVRRACKAPGLTVALLTGLFFASLLIYPFLGLAFFPQTDAGQFTINLKAPTGSRIENTEQYVARVEDLIRRVVKPDDFKMVVSNIGVVPDFSSLYTTNAGPYTATVQVQLQDEHRIGSFEYMDRVREAMGREYPELRTFFSSGSMVDAILNSGALAPIDVQVVSPRLHQIYDIAQTLATRIRRMRGVGEVYIPQDMNYPAVNLDIDRVHAGELGLSQEDVVDNVITALNSNYQIAPNYWVDRSNGNDYYLTVQYFEHGRPAIHTIADLKNIPLRAPNLTQPTTLDSVVKIREIQTPTEVDHYQIQRVVDVFVTPKGEDLGRVRTEILNMLAASKSEFPDQVRISLHGMVQSMNASFVSFGFGFSISFILLLLILIAQFRSFVDPFLIMLAIPMGFIGVLVILPLTGTTLNVMSLMGVLMLIGIADSNSILIVDFAHRLEDQGLSPMDAVITACRVRLRPILMTSLATIIGMIPMALKMGEGAEQYAPMARAIIGGLSSSVAFTVFIVPAAYLLVYGKKNRPGTAVSVPPTLPEPAGH